MKTADGRRIGVLAFTQDLKPFLESSIQEARLIFGTDELVAEVDSDEDLVVTVTIYPRHDPIQVH